MFFYLASSSCFLKRNQPLNADRQSNMSNYFFHGAVRFLVLTASCYISLPVAVSSVPDTLIQAGADWKYLDDGSDQGTGWTSIAFQDSLWSSAPAEFGYGDGDETTVISYGPFDSLKYVTSYFRKTFSVTDATIYKSLRLNLKRDDGAVVYLNGTEIYRSNMPGDTITSSTFASASISDGAESIFLSAFLSPAGLVNGTNVIAVEIHLVTTANSDLSFDLSLLGDTAVVLARSPYLQLATPNSMYVCWRTSVPEAGKILYGQTLSFSDSILEVDSTVDHFVQIQGLSPATKYYYSVYSSEELLAGDSSYYFYTPPVQSAVTPVRIWTMGDFGTSHERQNLIRDAYFSYTADSYTNLLLWLGDNAYPSGSDEEYTYNVFTGHYESILRQSVSYSTLGNHELFYSSAANQTGPYFDQFIFPENGEAGGVASGTEAYYSFNYSNIHFVCLESNIDSFGMVNTTAMLNWLNADLAANTQQWIIVYFHSPPYSKGYHDSDIEDDQIYMRQTFLPVLENYSVDLVLSGHSHDYERSYLLHGHYGTSSTFDTSVVVDQGGGEPPDFYTKVPPFYEGAVYAVVGCGGEIQTIQPDWPHPAMFYSTNTDFGSMVIVVHGDTLEAKLLLMSDSIADHFAIVKTLSVGFEENEKKISFSVYPNPAGKKLFISYYSKQPSPVTIMISNIAGDLISSWSEKSVQSYLKQVDISHFPAGAYFVQLISGDQSVVRKFLKQ